MEKPEPRFEDGTEVYDPEYKEIFEFNYNRDWCMQDRLVIKKVLAE